MWPGDGRDEELPTQCKRLRRKYRFNVPASSRLVLAEELRHAYLQQVFMRLPYEMQRMHHDVSWWERGVLTVIHAAIICFRSVACWLLLCLPTRACLAPLCLQEVDDMQGEQAWGLLRQFVADEVECQRGGSGSPLGASPGDTSGGSVPGR